MNDKYISEVYWESSANAYYQGSQISSSQKRYIIFRNSLMEPGVTIIKWNSTNYYQAEKQVPPLPLLQANHRYQLVTKATSNPALTLLTRIEFFNIQGDQIKKYEFSGQRRQFVYPVGAFSYRISLVNMGVESLKFDRLMIASNHFPEESFDDVWFQPALWVSQKPELTMLLVQEGIHSRVEYDRPLPGQVNQQVVSFAWQNNGNLVSEFNQKLLGNQQYKIHLVSTNPSLDEVVMDVCAKHPNIDGLVTDQTDQNDLPSYHLHPVVDWASPELNDPDWTVIGKAVNNYLKGE